MIFSFRVTRDEFIDSFFQRPPFIRRYRRLLVMSACIFVCAAVVLALEVSDAGDPTGGFVLLALAFALLYCYLSRRRPLGALFDRNKSWQVDTVIEVTDKAIEQRRTAIVTRVPLDLVKLDMTRQFVYLIIDADDYFVIPLRVLGAGQLDFLRTTVQHRM